MKLSIFNRRRKILSCLDQGHVDIQELSNMLNVSPMTVRRDLLVLEKQGKVLRTFGGAVVREKLAYEFSFHEKASKNKPSKDLIGKIGAALVHPREVIFIDTGTTALAVAMALRGIKPCTIVTTNLCVASELVGQQDIRVLVAGGELSSISPDVRGEWSLEILANIHVDAAFLGCDAVSPAEGFYASDLKAAAVSQTILPRSRRKYLVADSTKFGTTSFCKIAPLTDLSAIITDDQLGERYRQVITDMGIWIYQNVPSQDQIEQQDGRKLRNEKSISG